MNHFLVTLRRPTALFGLLLLLIQMIFILFAPLMMPFDPMQADPLVSLQAPSALHWFGTDINGMDVFSRVIYATRINLLISVVSVFIAFIIGVPLGLIIGYYRSPLSHLAMRVFDFIQSFPIFVLGMALVSVTGQEIWNVAIVLAVLFTPVFARLIRAEVLSLRDRPFVAAARCSGAGDRQIMFSHLLPNAMLPAMIQVSISIGMAILLTAGLSFVGAGVRMPTPEWGLMVASGAQQMILGVWWVSLFPGIAIVISVLSFALLGDAIRDWLDPRKVRRGGGNGATAPQVTLGQAAALHDTGAKQSAVQPAASRHETSRPTEVSDESRAQ